MKKFISLLICMVAWNCVGQSLNDIDKLFENCFNEQQQELIQEYDFGKETAKRAKNIHILFENFLLKENYLSGTTKEDYIKLFERIQRGDIEENETVKFSDEMGFHAQPFLWSVRSLYCHGFIIEQLKLIDSTSWQYKVAVAYNEHEAKGNFVTNTRYLINTIKQVPLEKFEKIYYKQLFLNSIYTALEHYSFGRNTTR